MLYPHRAWHFTTKCRTSEQTQPTAHTINKFGYFWNDACVAVFVGVIYLRNDPETKQKYRTGECNINKCITLGIKLFIHS